MRNETHTLAKKYAQANPDKTIGRRPKKGKPYLGRVELRGVDYKVRQTKEDEAMKEEAATNRDKVMQAQETDLELESVVGGADPPIITSGGG